MLLGCLFDVGSFKIFPIVNVFDVRLFRAFNSEIVVLYLLAIPYRVSPFWTVYVDGDDIVVGGVYGIFLYSRMDFITASTSSL